MMMLLAIVQCKCLYVNHVIDKLTPPKSIDSICDAVDLSAGLIVTLLKGTLMHTPESSSTVDSLLMSQRSKMRQGGWFTI